MGLEKIKFIPAKAIKKKRKGSLSMLEAVSYKKVKPSPIQKAIQAGYDLKAFSKSKRGKNIIKFSRKKVFEVF